MARHVAVLTDHPLLRDRPLSAFLDARLAHQSPKRSKASERKEGKREYVGKIYKNISKAWCDRALKKRNCVIADLYIRF